MFTFSSNLPMSRQRAFTLAEMAIVVVLAGILLTMGLKMTQSNLTNTAYAQTASNQALIKQALINYLRTNGTLPCPDTNAVPNGSQVTPCATAAKGTGVVPWTTLQISKDTALDGWGNFFTYQVANGVAPIVRNWTTKAVAATSFDLGQLGNPAIGITIMQGDGVVLPTVLTTNAVVVIISYGQNSFGATTLQGKTNAPPPATNVDETTNTTIGAKYVIRPYSNSSGSTGGPFDDRVAYMLPQDLLQPLVTEQTVSVCKAYCPVCTGAGTAAGVAQPYCTGANTPATSATASSCKSAGSPYPTCTAAYTPAMCVVTTTSPISIGNPTPSCP